MSRRKESFTAYAEPDLVEWFRERSRKTKIPLSRYFEQALVDLRAKLVAKPPEEPQL